MTTTFCRSGVEADDAVVTPGETESVLSSITDGVASTPSLNAAKWGWPLLSLWPSCDSSKLYKLSSKSQQGVNISIRHVRHAAPEKEKLQRAKKITAEPNE